MSRVFFLCYCKRLFSLVNGYYTTMGNEYGGCNDFYYIAGIKDI